MPEPTVLVKHPRRNITVRQFGEGAEDAGNEAGISVIIDNFRASNTILALLEAGAEVTPVETIEEATQFEDYIKVGEKGGNKHPLFDFDNSPYIVSQNPDLFENKKVVIRTTNGTRGIVNSKGSKEIIVGSFRNLTAVVDYLEPFAKNHIPISMIAMGSKDIPRIEDKYGAKMIFYKLIERLDNSNDIIDMLESEDNPWNHDWVSDIKKERKLTENNRDDRLYSLQLDKTRIIPKFNHEFQKLIPIKVDEIKV